MNKPYTKVLKENFYQYLVSIETIKNTKHKLKYIFNINDATTEDRNYFNAFVKKYICWNYFAYSNTVSYVTDSTTLRDMFNHNNEQVEDIPSHILDTTKYVIENPLFKQEFNLEHTVSGRFKQEYPAGFKQKEKEMNDNFEVNYNINIKVDGNDYMLTDPISALDALPVVLKLGARVAKLKERKDLLEDSCEVLSSVENIVEVFDTEISDIQEVIDYINENIGDVKE